MSVVTGECEMTCQKLRLFRGLVQRPAPDSIHSLQVNTKENDGELELSNVVFTGARSVIDGRIMTRFKFNSLLFITVCCVYYKSIYHHNC